MKRTVVKFGGSNLKSREDILKVINAIKNYREPIIIVVSALYGVTNRLIKSVTSVKQDKKAINVILKDLNNSHRRIIEKYIKDKDIRENTLSKLDQRIEKLGKYLLGIHCLEDIPNCAEDMLLSYGERLSSLLLGSILKYMDIDCRELLPENIGLVTDGEYGNATIDLEQSKKNIRNIFSGNTTYIIPGFYGISTEYRITTLGRGGSDYSASAIAYCVNASSVDIWKDVSGFLSADPDVVKHPVGIKELSYSEAAELSYFGAKIFHPLTFEPLLNNEIPVKIFDINNQKGKRSPLTVISSRSIIKRTVVKSVACIDNIGVIRLGNPGIGIKSNIISKAIDQIAELGVNIKTMISSMTSMNILVSKSDLNKCCGKIKSLKLPTIDTIECYDDSSLIALVGEGMDKRRGIAVRALRAVSEKKINIQLIASGTSRVAIYFLIDSSDRAKTIRAIHGEFFGKK